MPSKRLAITIAGAVSLGSFEAGVLYEILSGLKRHNQSPNTKPDDRIEIDVLTGASAGGMTATIAAQKLLYESSALDGAYQNSFYRPWILDVNINGLLALQSDEDPSHSILSSNFVEAISNKYLTNRYRARITQRDPHPAAAGKISLGLALSNLNGINYSQPTYPIGSFNYTKYQDQMLHEALGPAEDNDTVWEPLRQAAVACGAFPFAFRMQELVRHCNEYPNCDPVNFPLPAEPFVNTDGGVFQNEPLGMAKNFVDNIDNHQNVDSRFYLFVSPGARDATADRHFTESQANFKGAAVTLAAAVFQQARFQDWITAEGVNKQIQLFNLRATQLRDAMINGDIQTASLRETADGLLKLFFRDKANEQAAAELRLRQQFAEDCNRLANEDRVNAWIKSILVFETAADLGPRDEMYICAVTATQAELASSGVSAFIGFFDQRYRDHDYDVGRTKAREQFLNTPPQGLGPLNWGPGEDIRPIDSSLSGLKISNVDQQKREQFRDRLRDRAHKVMQEMGVNAVIREGADLFFIKPQLNKVLGL